MLLPGTLKYTVSCQQSDYWLFLSKSHSQRHELRLWQSAYKARSQRHGRVAGGESVRQRGVNGVDGIDRADRETYLG